MEVMVNWGENLSSATIYPASISKYVPGKGIPFFIPVLWEPAYIGGYGKLPYEIHLVVQDSIPTETSGYGKQSCPVPVAGRVPI